MLALSEPVDLIRLCLLEEASSEPICRNLEELCPPRTAVYFWEALLLCFDLTPLKVTTGEDLLWVPRYLETEDVTQVGKKNNELWWLRKQVWMLLGAAEKVDMVEE